MTNLPLSKPFKIIFIVFSCFWLQLSRTAITTYLIFYSSKKFKVPSCSSCDSDYRNYHMTTKMAAYLWDDENFVIKKTTPYRSYAFQMVLYIHSLWLIKVLFYNYVDCMGWQLAITDLKRFLCKQTCTFSFKNNLQV